MNKINTSQWCNFEKGKLFVKVDMKCLNPNFNKKWDVSTEPSDEFNLPLVNAKHFNNGIMYYGRDKDFQSAEMT